MQLGLPCSDAAWATSAGLLQQQPARATVEAVLTEMARAERIRVLRSDGIRRGVGLGHLCAYQLWLWRETDCVVGGKVPVVSAEASLLQVI